MSSFVGADCGYDNAMKLSKMKDRTALVKFTGKDHPQPVPLKMAGSDDTGIWFQNTGIAEELLGKGRISQPLIGKKPFVFVPLSQIEWLMVPDTDGP